MKLRYTIRLVRAAALTATFTIGAHAAVAAPSISDLAWLAGCWQADGAEPGSLEQWMPPAGGTMLAASRTIKGGKTVTFEFLRIREAPDGRLEFIANPAGQAEATFPLLRVGEHEVVFENPQHDFPQRIMYRLEEPGRLKARIEGRQGDKVEGEDYPMRRVPCDSAAPAKP